MIGIICAMEEELQAVLTHVKEEKQVRTGTTRLHYGTLNGQAIVACLSGVGKVNAAMAATIVCMEPAVDLVMNVGVAGGLRSGQHVCDLVISDALVQADFDSSPLDGEEGIGLRFPVRPELVRKASAIARQLDIPYHVGTIATQDLFMARPEDFAKLMDRFPQSACAEMEGGAIAQVAIAFEKPVLVLRTLSDVVHHADNPMEFSKFAALASRQAADVIAAWCAQA